MPDYKRGANPSVKRKGYGKTPEIITRALLGHGSGRSWWPQNAGMKKAMGIAETVMETVKSYRETKLRIRKSIRSIYLRG